MIDCSYNEKIYSCFVKSLPAQLTPFVRSDAVGSILAETLGHPDREFSLSDLSRRSGVSLPVVHREVGRLVAGEVLLDRYEGRNRLVRANTEHPLFVHMSDLIALTYGPVPVLRARIDDLADVEEAFIYGSWAARRAGKPGPFPNDIDVLVIGDVSRRVLNQIAGEAGAILDIPVQITRISEDEWGAENPSAFVTTVRSRPIVDLRTGEVHGS